MKGNGRRKGLGWNVVRRWRCKEMLEKTSCASRKSLKVINQVMEAIPEFLFQQGNQLIRSAFWKTAWQPLKVLEEDETLGKSIWERKTEGWGQNQGWRVRHGKKSPQYTPRGNVGKTGLPTTRVPGYQEVEKGCLKADCKTWQWVGVIVTLSEPVQWSSRGRARTTAVGTARPPPPPLTSVTTHLLSPLSLSMEIQT